MNRRIVVIGFLGSNLDKAKGDKRWAAWRPTVGIFQHEDFLIDRLELLHDARDHTLAERVTADIATVSPKTELHRHPISVRDPWDFEEVYASFYDFSCGYDFDVDSYDYLIHITTGTHVQQICLFLLTESRHIPGSLLQTSPPRGQRSITNSSGNYRVIDLDLSRYDKLAARFEQEQREGLSYLKSGIDTRNVAFNKLIEQIEHVSLATRAPILLLGPTGAGKSRLARRIYELKRHREHIAGEFIEVNCATLRGDQAMSALFGHQAGAFTGASSDRDGFLKTADGGMLFLDEIGELGLDEQAMLLHAIEEKRFQPVGSDREISSDFQLIAGTNRNLRQCSLAGDFREDLLARINLWTFDLPGLADRSEDIEPNLDYELAQFSSESGRKITINKEARDRFIKFAKSDAATWRANFRDLNAAVQRMSTLATGARINSTTVDDEIERLRQHWQLDRDEPTNDVVQQVLGKRASTLDRFDRVQLAEVIRVCQQSTSLSEAGRKLFEHSRQSKKQPNDADRLRKYLARFELSWSDLNS